MKGLRYLCVAVLIPLWLAACGRVPWNNPYPAADDQANILYSAFSERPKHLDPARSYSANEATFTGQIYEPPLQYHYLKRPYALVPLSAAELPQPKFFDANGAPLPVNAAPSQVAMSVYEIKIKPGIFYQPHPAFAKDALGNLLYHALGEGALDKIRNLSDFPVQGSRELVAADFVYQIKRLANPRLHSPILGVMGEHIIGLKDYARQLSEVDKALKKSNAVESYLDLENYPLAGAEIVDRYVYRIKIKGKYPQFIYWLAMPFFAPIPVEAERFYAQPGMEQKNFNIDWHPVGTGPYMLSVNDPNRQMILRRNPNFHGEAYPMEGEPTDVANGFLKDAGKALPFIDKVVFSLEKESIPYWNKFLQGYYDASGVSSDSFDQAIRMTADNEPLLTPTMQSRDILLRTTVETSIFYMGFNMADPDIGGPSERNRKLRQAIAIAIDYEEFISIFRNGRGLPAHGPLPPGIFGYTPGEKGINPYIYDVVNGKPERKSIEFARQLMAEAGYPNGRDAKTGKPLLIHLDTMAGSAEDKTLNDWFRKQFQKLNLQLDIRATDYNRFQDKVRKGNAQLFIWGWNADYPDPENFLFLLYGPNSKVRTDGENASNYSNPEFDRLFEQMKNMDNTPQRQEIINRMVSIVQRDSPWVWGFFPKQFRLQHAWQVNVKANLMANNELKYFRVDAATRAQKRSEWNRPIVWPTILVLGLLLIALLPAYLNYRQSEQKRARMLEPKGGK